MNTEPNGNEGVSVVVCCYNSERRLPATLEHLGRQVIPDGLAWEVVVVDNASTDDTARVAEREWPRCGGNGPLRVIHEPTPGLSAARKAGIDAARYGFVLFVDDDNWLTPNYVAQAAEIMNSDDRIGAIGGKGEPVFEVEPPEWFFRFKRYFAIGRPYERSGDNPDSPGCIYGAGMLLRQSAWHQIESAGFETLLAGRTRGILSSGEDYEVCLALRLAGYTIRYDERLRFRHFITKGRLRWSYMLKLTEGIHRSSIYLNPYYKLLDANKSERADFAGFWPGKIVRLLPRMIREYGRILGRRVRRRDSKDHEQRFRRLVGECRAYLDIRGREPDLHAKVQEFQARLDGNSKTKRGNL